MDNPIVIEGVFQGLLNVGQEARLNQSRRGGINARLALLKKLVRSKSTKLTNLLQIKRKPRGHQESSKDIKGNVFQTYLAT